LKKKILFFLKYLIFLIIGFGLFWLAVKDADFNQMLTEFKNANYTWILLSIFSMLASHIIRALRWNQLLDTLHYKTKTITTFYAVMIGYFVNLAVPRLGEITRCGVLANYHKVPVNSVIGTVIAERAFDMITLGLIILIIILSQLYFLHDFLFQNVFDPIISRFSNGTAAFLIIAGSLIGFILLCVILYRIFLPRLRKMKLFHKILDLVKGFWTGIKTIKYIHNKGLFILYTLLMWGCYTLTVYVSCFALSATMHLTFIDALTIMALGSIGIIAPTPGGIGAYQYVVMITLVGLFLIPKSPALSFANIMYFTQWFMIIIFGGISWIILFMSQKRNLKNEHS